VLVLWWRKTGEPTENPLEQGENLNNKLNPVITPGPHWWEASSLATAPSLLSKAEMHARVKIAHSSDKYY